MRRGELYRVRRPTASDPERERVVCIVSRQVLIDSPYATAICAPVYSSYHRLTTQVPLGIDDGMKQDCSIHCDNLMSLEKRILTDFIATLSAEKIDLLNQALDRALEL